MATWSWSIAINFWPQDFGGGMKLLALALIATPALLSAQTAAQPPRPGPEVQKLAVFAGRWTSDGEVKPGPMGPGGKMASTSNCEWFSGGFYLVCRTNGTMAGAPMQGLGI